LSFYGGAELLIVKLANYLTKKGINNTILTLSVSEEVKNDLKGTHVISLNKKMFEGKNRILKLIKFINGTLLLWKYVQINRKNYDVINVHNFPADYSLFPFARNSVWMCNEPPIQLYLRQYTSPILKFFQKLMRKIDKFIVRSSVKHSCVSDEFNAERFERIYAIKPKIINYGIEYDFFSKGNEKNVKKMFNLYNNFILLQVGTLTPLKNQMESIRVVEKVKEKIPNVKLILAGLGEEKYEAMLKNYVQRKKLEKYVLFTGNLSRKTVRDLYKACDAALFPIKSQGGWLSPFEALCAGKPIIVSSSMTAADIIKRNELGIVTDDFSETVVNIYKNQKKYNAMANKGKKWVRENLTWDKFCEGMLELFQKSYNL
jgi:glycosyltransferase involved in cell wall biosynthesis